MRRPHRPTSDAQPSLYEEATLLARLSESQTQLASEVLGQAARTGSVSQRNAELARELAGSFDRLQEIHHRVRNHLQTVTGLLSAAEVEEHSPTARRTLQKSVARLSSIAAIHDLLARDPASGELRLPDLAHQLAHHLLNQTNAAGRIRVRTDVEHLSLDTRQATAFVLILTELLSNALEHAFADDERGQISLRVSRHGASAILEVRDTGRGLPHGFDLTGADGLGLQLIARLAERDLGGAVAASNDGGACFRVRFSIEPSEAPQ
jgi:two-component sensor histidine kinase